MVRNRKGKEIAAPSGNTDHVPSPYNPSRGIPPSATDPSSPTVPSSSSMSHHDLVSLAHDSAFDVGADQAPSTDNTQRTGIFIESHGAELTHQFECAQHVGHIIERFYDKSWKSWKAIPQDVRDMWFEEWGRQFTWRDEDAYVIRKNFEHIGANNLKNRLHRARSSNSKPSWMGDETWNELKTIWGNQQYQKVSEQNKKNRASDCGQQGFPLHMGGCVSFGEHARKLTQELGHTPTIADTFLRVHSSSDTAGHRRWVNDWARTTHETHTQRMSEISSQNSIIESNGDELNSKPTELQVWTETVGAPKKGRLRGLGGQMSFGARGASSTSTSNSQLARENETLRNELETYKNELENCKSQISSLQAQFDAFQSRIAPPPNIGISKGSRVLNINEDIFAGFNCTLRKGNVTHHEYIQFGKGGDVGLNQISTFEAKIASGSAEQILSRDVYGLGRLYSALSGTESFFSGYTDENAALLSILSQEFVISLGIFVSLPMIVEGTVENGFLVSVWEFTMAYFQLALVFYTFSLGTRAHYFGRTLLHGGAKYQGTGREFAVQHQSFVKNYMLYARSHFYKAIELGLIITVYSIYSPMLGGTFIYLGLTLLSWFLVVSWILGPFIFNPLSFDWLKTVNDFHDF